MFLMPAVATGESKIEFTVSSVFATYEKNKSRVQTIDNDSCTTS